ncbi:hypothetical protein [Cohnella silvisoli]|uniref:YqzN/YkzM domain-containing protein n=1 Tax=Cohnella silvisoli TaxID=2873699 RepID=A0ABV1KM57_9BACL|nr:hypothetical protein [Cohnella silvisoli]MCD9020499.1 hypothetical protein [Cohnella silvisoli]
MANKKPEYGDDKYSRDELVQNAQALFSVNSEAAAGALHGTIQDQFTIDEAKRLVGHFMKRKVL